LWFNTFDLSRVWSAEFFSLWSTCGALPDIKPGEQVAMSLGDSVIFWDPRRKKRISKPRLGRELGVPDGAPVAIADAGSGDEDGGDVPDEGDAPDEVMPDADPIEEWLAEMLEMEDLVEGGIIVPPSDGVPPPGPSIVPPVPVFHEDPFAAAVGAIDAESDVGSDIGSVIGGKKGKPIARADFYGGWIAVYRSHAGLRFEAKCGNCIDHGNKCRIGRTNLAREGAPAAGRPLGFIACHLKNNGQSCKDDHMLNALVGYSHEDRTLARDQLSLCVGAEELFQNERPLRVGELQEPLGSC
jgi:hypothetical protein